MTIAFFMMRASQALKDIGSADFYKMYPAVQRVYSDISEWTGISIPLLLDEEITDTPEVRHALLAIRSIALHLAIHDVLAEQGVRPDVAFGLSLGFTSASCVAGALGRRDAVGLQWQRRNVPDSPEQAVASCWVREGRDPQDYYGDSREDVHLVADFGPAPDGRSRFIMLGGYKETLECLAAEDPGAGVTIYPRTRASHTPLRKHDGDFLRSQLSGVAFTDPVIPLIAGLSPGVLATAAEVRDAIWQNQVLPVRIPYGMSEMARRGVRLCISLGPTQVDSLMTFPCPVMRISKPGHVAAAVGRCRELGISASSG
jgi:[acyl-carrier-protein] S-malonyltransferase